MLEEEQKYEEVIENRSVVKRIKIFGILHNLGKKTIFKNLKDER